MVIILIERAVLTIFARVRLYRIIQDHYGCSSGGWPAVEELRIFSCVLRLPCSLLPSASPRKMWSILFIALSFSSNAFGSESVTPEVGAAPRMTRSTTKQSNEINQKWNSTWTDKLKKDLLLNYDKFARPAEFGSKIRVYIGIAVRHIEMDEQKSIMTIHSWLKMHWADDKLKWNASDYGGLKTLHLADHEVWQPDIYPYNGIIGSISDHFGNTNCIASENGTVIWVPPSIFQVFCDLDMTYWPFDTQMCSIILGSWTYSENDVDLEFDSAKEEVDKILIRNSEWKFIKVEKERNSRYYPCCVEPYVDVMYNITVQRQSPTYVALLITPATAIILMALCVFFIPPASTDKITLGGTTIIINSLFLLYFTQKLPVLAGRTPLIVLFYSRTLYLLSFSLIISVIVINIAKNPKFSPLPWNIKRLLTGCLGKCLLINTLTCKNTAKQMPNSPDGSDSLPVLSEQEKHQVECSNYESFQQDWISLAVAIDRIAFLIFSFIFIVLALTYFV